MLLEQTLKAMVALTETNSDILTSEGMQLMLQLISDWKLKTNEPAVAEYLVYTFVFTRSYNLIIYITAV